MLQKDDVVYYKVKLQQLFKQAYENGLEIKLSTTEVSFIDNKSKEGVSAKLIIDNNKIIKDKILEAKKTLKSWEMDTFSVECFPQRIINLEKVIKDLENQITN